MKNSMAEVLTKASLVSSSWHGVSQRHHHRRVSTVLSNNTCSFRSGVGKFSSLKMNSQVLRSWSSSSEFQGIKLVFHVNRGLPNRVNSRLRASTGAQVCKYFYPLWVLPPKLFYFILWFLGSLCIFFYRFKTPFGCWELC